MYTGRGFCRIIIKITPGIPQVDLFPLAADQDELVTENPETTKRSQHYRERSGGFVLIEQTSPVSPLSRKRKKRNWNLYASLVYILPEAWNRAKVLLSGS